MRLQRLYEGSGLEVFAKLETLNPGGSLKDRSAWNIIRGGLESGKICPDTVVVESSSGNMGVGLAQTCRYLGLRFICVVDARVTDSHVALMQAYGAEIDVVSEPDPASGEFLQARIARVRKLLALHPGAFWPNQLANRHNSEAHAQGTMREIAEALDHRVDYVVCAISTCGTLRGCAEYVRDHRLGTTIVAVDAEGSAISGGERALRLIPGLGAGLVPDLFSPELADECVRVSNLDCLVGCRRLLLREAILAGGSAGGVVMAFERLRNKFPNGSRCVLLLCDRGERYLGTIFSDSWVATHFGNVAHLWDQRAGIT